MAMTMIKTELLFPHPQNPRRDVGDVTELAESIKANGIFQNLTVIKGGAGVPEGSDGYTVIIGHRRLAASKLAGLSELPCSIVEMSEKEQVGTMLLENMQRSDLTIYEQAQGFQMMLDLGESLTSISKSTGLSETTVRHRVKLLELDKEKFEKSQERDPSIADYIELEKIKDINVRNKCLEKIGTKDFDWEVKKAIQNETNDKRRAEWYDYLNSVAEEVKIGERSNREQLVFFYVLNAITDDNKEKIKELADSEGKLYWAKDNYNYVYIFGKEKPIPKNDEKDKYAEKELQRKLKCDEVSRAENRAWELRRNFVENFVGTRIEHFPIIYKSLIKELYDPDCIDFDELAAMLHITFDDEDFDIVNSLLDNSKFNDMIVKHPQKIGLAVLFAIKDDEGRHKVHDWYGNYSKNKALEEWYSFLEMFGYMISTEEQQLLNGTHEVFKD